MSLTSGPRIAATTAIPLQPETPSYTALKPREALKKQPKLAALDKQPDLVV